MNDTSVVLTSDISAKTLMGNFSSLKVNDASVLTALPATANFTTLTLSTKTVATQEYVTSALTNVLTQTGPLTVTQTSSSVTGLTSANIGYMLKVVSSSIFTFAAVSTNYALYTISLPAVGVWMTTFNVTFKTASQSTFQFSISTSATDFDANWWPQNIQSTGSSSGYMIANQTRMIYNQTANNNRYFVANVQSVDIKGYSAIIQYCRIS